jgi:hypothetical protein
MFAWSQLDFSAIPVSISESLYKADKFGKMLTVREDCKELKMYRKRKDIRGRDIQLLLSLFLLFLGRSFQQLNFEWYQQKLLAEK